MEKLEVIIPTRNRQKLLLECLANLNQQTSHIYKVIVVDSSDQPTKIPSDFEFKTKYIYTDIKSAAMQRNIGLSSTDDDCNFVGFIDDDVRVPKEYFNRLINILKDSDGIGACGVTNDTIVNGINPIATRFKQFFYLKNKKNGHVNKAGINNSIQANIGIIESDWLLGCAVWNKKKFKSLKFDETLKGLSLGEDVMLSLDARQYGKLFVDSSIIIDHLRSHIARPNDFQFWRMWAFNRKKIIFKLTKTTSTNFYYYWANLGQILAIIFFHKKSLYSKLLSVLGIFMGTLDDSK